MNKQNKTNKIQKLKKRNILTEGKIVFQCLPYI